MTTKIGTRRSKAKNGRAKGKNFEGVVAKAFSVWWGDPEKAPATERSFRRTPGSGGIDAREWPGDVYPRLQVADSWPWVVECKANDSAFSELLQLLFNEKNAIDGWITKVAGEAEGVGRDWLLVVKRTYFPTIVFFSAGLFKDLPTKAGKKLMRARSMRYKSGAFGGLVSVMSFKKFLRIVKPEDARELRRIQKAI